MKIKRDKAQRMAEQLRQEMKQEMEKDPDWILTPDAMETMSEIAAYDTALQMAADSNGMVEIGSAK